MKMDGVHLRHANGASMDKSKDVVITGVSTGIGRETTRLFLSKGYRVFGTVRKQTDADRLQKEMGDRYVPLIMDVTDADAIQRAREKVEAMLGSNRLAGLVNNAGIVVSGPLLYLRPSEFRRQLEANMVGPLMVTQAFAPLLGTDDKKTGPVGRIVNISSTVAKVVPPFLGAYAASKWGLEGMSEALRRELMLFGIDLVIIEPGAVNTAMYDKGETDDLSEFKTTPYWGAIENFQKYIVAEGRKGLSPERLAKAVYVALTAAKPKTRYAVVPQRLKNWTLPRLLPDRAVDKAIAKQMGFVKK
ncbi:SDR family oxidoreductase [Granulicella paludicola]|uniref:SDR family oxidoreductase n=1 Tax=Granulicella paludicola TaxID=474951 RepID=UPI0021DF96D8|nr:SDR family oxidoreductase [Granulicella paludicola]